MFWLHIEPVHPFVLRNRIEAAGRRPQFDPVHGRQGRHTAGSTSLDSGEVGVWQRKLRNTTI
ncbi:MAG: hypothetical protein IPF53_16090 [Blastocatellia bacterium]|nr:hypothetical protein [Blastocatellia bacterium]MBK6428972.1 hypothetical protein [Blastocatellia bacterium]